MIWGLASGMSAWGATEYDTFALEIFYNGEKIGSVNVISSENIEKADFLTQIKKVFGRLLK